MSDFTFGRRRRFRSDPNSYGGMIEMTPEECADADRIEARRDKSNDPIVVDIDEETGTITLGRPR